MNHTGHRFYTEIMGSLLETMIYGLFEFHIKFDENILTTDRTGYITREFFNLIEGGKPQNATRGELLCRTASYHTEIFVGHDKTHHRIQRHDTYQPYRYRHHHRLSSRFTALHNANSRRDEFYIRQLFQPLLYKAFRYASGRIQIYTSTNEVGVSPRYRVEHRSESYILFSSSLLVFRYHFVQTSCSIQRARIADIG